MLAARRAGAIVDMSDTIVITTMAAPMTIGSHSD
jgi:hypothetical protein